MIVSIIGSGNVATHLAKALKTAHVQVLNVWSNRFENAQALAVQVNANVIAELTDFASDKSDIILIAVKDDAIGSVVEKLHGYRGIVAHTSGSAPLAVLSNFENFGVFYPLQTFSKHKEVDFNVVPLCLEANNTATLAQLKSLAGLLTRKQNEVDSEQRKILHLAAVFACNFPNYLYGIAQQLLAEHQLDFDLIRPLIAETANKVQNDLPVNVQTGPAVRNDEQTLLKHEGLLAQHPEWLTIYKLLSEQIKKG
ncbi:MAG: DUF2520 domain-containing protein [Pedobacter sp.]|nr:MAG: DUF2520 domain-containing protein [Pedobacter sp.]